jgi:excisionase family DNA binding protein
MSENKQTHFKINELARRWSVSHTFIRRAIWNGQLKATRFGRAIRISIREADRYAESQLESR